MPSAPTPAPVTDPYTGQQAASTLGSGDANAGIPAPLVILVDGEHSQAITRLNALAVQSLPGVIGVPAAPTVTPSAGASTTVGYYVVPVVNGVDGVPSPTTTISTGAATPNNTVTWAYQPGVTGWKVVRQTQSPGLISGGTPLPPGQTSLLDANITATSAPAVATTSPLVVLRTQLVDTNSNALGASTGFPLYVNTPNLLNTADAVQTWPALTELSNAATPAFGTVMNWSTIAVSMGRIRALYLLITTAFANASTLGTVTMQPYVGRTAGAGGAGALDSQHLLLSATGLTIGTTATTLPINNLYRLSAGALLGTGLTAAAGLAELANVGDPFIGLQLTFTTAPTSGAATFYAEVTGA